ncbi:MAG: hypothetical protein V1920_02220, partial [Bacillota bacterium]
MKIQGASEIAIYALSGLHDFAEKKGFGHMFEEECHKLVKTRPTAVVLHSVIHALKKDPSLDKIDEMIDALQSSRTMIA